MRKKHLKIGVLFGAGVGLCAGILTNTIAIGLALGAGAGLVLGSPMRTKFKKKN